ncbi:glycoside hydrolase family 2 protein [Paenibacillus xerothermodurans]|uniref:Glycoside hydrolase family 2 protein n=1 Tax=Paenibacillus xerothermodurans TaxID=1977292 RepID=A0A2W1NLG4_PAEXE|nr:glycoside hydrolase family 2 TIM barrel-domain containing protein [Paenibacillus xerothermodurans]PZE20265.1 glycoside hydrolase family 2 protein [Paenibacillus xerothermodurans]
MIKQRLTQGWEHHRGSLGGAWEVWRQDKLQNHYNVPWHGVELPHSYNALDVLDPDGKYYQGQGWYRTRLNVNNPYPGGRTLLHFEGAGQRSDVYVYTEKVGSHLGGYDEFTVDITDAAESARAIERYNGLTPVAVGCDNSRDLETIPSDASDFNLYGGLYRYVNLVYVPAVSLRTVHVQSDLAEDHGTCRIAVRAELYNPKQLHDELQMTVRLSDGNGQEVAVFDMQAAPWEGMQQLAEHELAQPELWSPDRPYLYRCTVEVRSRAAGQESFTALTEAFGVRRFEFVKHGPFMLNGERLLLRGTHRHEDHAGVGPAMTEDMIRTEMQLIKDMGANFIRLGHYQQSRIVLDLCDQLGLLVWEEIPWCRGGLGGESYRQQCRDMLTAMIEQHYNHPSIILWGLGNENDWECDFDYFDQEEIRAFMKELHELSHRLDPSRLTAIRRCEFCKDIIDVYSPSIWAGWYRGIYTDYEESSRQAMENVDRFFHMEWGADNLATRHVEKTFTGFEFLTSSGGSTDERDGDYLLTGGEPRVSRDGDWSETYFCEMIDWYLKSQEKMDWLTGAAQWAFKDFATPVRPDSPIPYLNMKGIIERDFTKKEAYYVYQSYWTEKPMVRIYGHTMPVRWGRDGERKSMKVYSNCTEAELFLNGVSLGVKRRDSQDFPAAGLRWETVLKCGTNQLRVVASKNGVTVSDELSFEYQTERWGEPAEIKLSAKTQADGTILVEALASDANGVLCADAANFVRFGLTGDGKLIDRQGTVRGSSLIQLTNGRARIVVDPAGGSAASVPLSGFVSASGPASGAKPAAAAGAAVVGAQASGAAAGVSAGAGAALAAAGSAAGGAGVGGGARASGAVAGASASADATLAAASVAGTGAAAGAGAAMTAAGSAAGGADVGGGAPASAAGAAASARAKTAAAGHTGQGGTGQETAVNVTLGRRRLVSVVSVASSGLPTAFITV